MTNIESAFYNFGYLERLSRLDSPVHRLDPGIKVLTTLFFIITVVSMDKYSVSGLLPFFIYPVYLASMGNISRKYIARKLLYLSVFALFIGIFNPVFDRSTAFQLGGITVTGGWVSFASIMVKYALTVSAALVLLAVTGFHRICGALERFRVPPVFIIQLMFLYRYIFLLVEEAMGLSRARALRSFSSKGMSFRVFVPLLGQLLLRTLDRAQRIHLAMCCRGFDGHVRLLKPMVFGAREIGFIVGWSLFFILARAINLPVLIGRFLRGFLS